MGISQAQARLLSNSPATYKIAGTLIGSYTIQSGDTFSAIADSLGIDLNALLAASPSIKPEELEVGQAINLPTKGTGLVFSLNDVLRILGVSVQALQSVNPGISNTLTIGETIKAPTSSGGGHPGGGGDLPGGTGGSNGGGGLCQLRWSRIELSKSI